MKISEIASPELSFRVEMRGYQHGQSDQTLSAFRDGQYVGHIDYSDYENEPHVQMIEVPKDLRRQGIGTALVQRLQAEYPGVEIDMGGLTDDGSKLLPTIPQTNTANPEHQALTARLEKLRAKEAEYQALADRFHANPNEADRARINAISGSWNNLNDVIEKIEQQLQDMRPSTRTYTAR
jgi:hypothetical protein